IKEVFVMSKRFKQNEKDAIRNALIEEGNLLFGKYGFQKTRITDITKKVGIAQGTFYNFFNSKELLYFAIIELEENKLTKKLIERNLSKESSDKEIIKHTF